MKEKRLPSEHLTPIEAHYDAARSAYWTPNQRGGYVMLNETSMRRVLRASGVSKDKGRDEMVSPLEQTLIDIQRNSDVDYAGPLAGYDMGLQTTQGRRVLVTEQPVLIVPKRGDWPVLEKFLANLFHDPDHDQLTYLHGWLKIAIEARLKKVRRPGQAVAVAGPHGCGKSLWQLLITEMLGGRAAKPYQAMTAATAFNADLFAAEHLTIEDEAASPDIRARRNLGAAIKNITVNDTQRCHGKNRTPVILTPYWRLTISLNDEPENMMVLPPIDDSIEDKLLLFKSYRHPMPMPTGTNEERHIFWNTLVSELPAFVHWLLNEFEIPPHLQSQRFGIVHFHHPELLAAIDDLAPERRLLTLIDMTVFTNGAVDWSGTSEELEAALTGKDAPMYYGARQLFKFNTACGVYLRRLANKLPDRVTERRLHGRREWRVLRDQPLEVQDE